MLQRVLDWVKRRGDQNIVSYSRFGLPGDEQDDRPPPTTVHVASFNEDSKEFMVFGTHSQRMALVSAGVGMSITIFIFLSVFFEFDWYHHRKGVDISALFGLLLFLFIGITIHWLVIKGIKTGQSRHLVAFIVVYCMIIFVEAIFFVFIVNHWIALSFITTNKQLEPGAFFAASATCIIILIIQGSMLFSVTRCRNYLDKKYIHSLEMRLVEKIKHQHPGITVVFGAGTPPSSNIGVANQSVSDPNPEASAPPTYEQAASMTAAPQRTILQAEDGLL